MATAVLLALCASPAEAAVELGIVSVAPGRPHFVAAGTSTTFVISTRNTSASPAAVSLRIQPSPGAAGDWVVVLFAADGIFRPIGAGSDKLDLTVPALGAVNAVARLTAGPQLAEGAEGGAVVSAWLQGSLQGSLELRTRIRNRPKIFYVALDGAGRGYLSLDRRGRPFDGTGERLMPRVWSFASRSALMTKASALLPSTTDVNHTAALTGSWPGTLGIYSVFRHYMGLDASGKPVVQDGTRDLLRWGPDGKPIETLFDVAKDPARAGAPDAFNVLITGKAWLGDLLKDGGRTLDLVVGPKEFPYYVPAPQRFRLGDPASDDDAQQDREGTNLGPRATKKIYSVQAQFVGTKPQRTPEDRWVAEAAIRIIAAEDPDVFYTDLAECDTVQHVFGGADRPEEWVDPGTPSVLWDDENIYNRNANRDPVLDIVHEADQVFGLITDQLEARQVLNRSLVVLLSDHGHSTLMNKPEHVLEMGRILEANGIGEDEVERLGTSGELGWIALRDPRKRDQIEAILQQHEEFQPVLQASVKPFLVLNRDEMDSGIDDVEGRLTEDGVAGNRKGELYSEWNIESPGVNASKVRWPDLFIFTRYHFQNSLLLSKGVTDRSYGAPFNGHHGSGASSEVIMAMSGPGIRPGAYDGAATLADIVPTIYRLLGVPAPGNVNGRALDEILSH